MPKVRTLVFRTTKDKPVPIPEPLPVGAIVIWTDGSCLGNGSINAKGGYSCVVKDHPERNGGWPLDDGVTPTNNRAEFAGFLRAAEIADSIDPHVPGSNPKDARTLVVITDSELLVNVVSKWVLGWRSKGWVKSDKKPVANRDMCERIAAVCDSRPVVMRHVKAHSARTDEDSLNNATADELAKIAAETQTQTGRF